MVVQVKFIKFFAWEERWIGRALDAREAEMQWMVKGADSSMKWLIVTIITDDVLSLQLASIRSCFTSFGRVRPFWCPLSRSSCLLCKEAS